MKRDVKKLAAVALVAAALALLLVGVFRETEGDRATRPIRDAVDALRRGDADGAVSSVAEDYFHDGLDRPGLRALAAGVIQYYGPARVRVLDKRVTVEGDAASCDLTVFASAPGAAKADGRSRSRWRVLLRREGDRWLVYQLSPVTFNGRPVVDLPTLCRHIPRR